MLLDKYIMQQCPAPDCCQHAQATISSTELLLCRLLFASSSQPVLKQGYYAPTGTVTYHTIHSFRKSVRALLSVWGCAVCTQESMPSLSDRMDSMTSDSRSGGSIALC